MPWSRGGSRADDDGMAEESSLWSWSTDGATLRGVLRPDGRLQLRLPEQHPSAWATLLDLAAADARAPLLVNRPGDDSAAAVTVLRSAGFTPVRKQTHWRVSVPELVGTRRRSWHRSRHRILPVTALDVAAVVALDNAVREDIPGTARWRGSVADMEEDLADPEFDPELYLVAQDPVSGGLDGLVRIWNRVPVPRLGCLAVRPAWRRSGLAAALVAAVAGTLWERGVTHITTETDNSNAAASLAAANLGGVRTGSSVAWCLWPDRRPADPRR